MCPFFWTKLNPLHPRMFSVKFGSNCLSGSGEEDFKFCECIFNLLFCNYHSLKMGMALHLNKIEKCFVPCLVEIGPVVLEKKIFKFWQCILLFTLLPPFGKGCGPSFEQKWFPFIQGCFVPNLVKIGPVVRETGDQKRSLELSVQVGLK